VTLQETVRGLGQIDGAATIYVADPWKASSVAIVARAPDDGGIPDEAVIAGCAHFLEVSVAREVLRHFPLLPGQEASDAAKCGVLITFAERFRQQHRRPVKPKFPITMMIPCDACGKHFDIVAISEGSHNYPCPTCGQVQAFDVVAFVKKAMEQSKGMLGKKGGHRPV